jgi:uncharacterized Zn finger protein (UPF0148 family)
MRMTEPERMSIHDSSSKEEVFLRELFLRKHCRRCGKEMMVNLKYGRYFCPEHDRTNQPGKDPDE